MKAYYFLFIILIVLALPLCTASIDAEREYRLMFDHLLYVSDISSQPAEIMPGSNGVLSFTITNTGAQYIRDVRINLDLPSELAPYQDITTRKIARMEIGDSANISFNIIALPDSEEGIHEAKLVLQYLNYIGDEREENDTISIVLGSSPKLLAELKSSDIYRGNNLARLNSM